MPTYRYKVRDQEGTVIKGEIEADSARDVKEKLFSEGNIPIEVREVQIGMFSFESITDIFTRVKPQDLMMFTRQFYTLFKAGVSMDTILDTMVKQVESRTLREALIAIKMDISGGASLAQAFGKHPKVFSPLYTSMLAAGEQAGILEEALRQMSDLIMKDYEIQKNVKGAILYPKIIMTVLVGAIAFLMVYVVPNFAAFYGRYGAELPLPTRILIGTSDFFTNYWYVIIGAVVTFLITYRRFVSTRVGRIKVDKLRLRMPVFGDLNTKVAVARFGHILSALYKSGLAMPQSLSVVSNTIDNEAFAQEILNVRSLIEKGTTLSEAMSKQTYFPIVVVESCAVGERSGALDEMLSTVADHYDMEVSYMIKNLTTLLEPILLVIIFSFVALLALAIFLPIWNMSTIFR